jgi:hypothetical protein
MSVIKSCTILGLLALLATPALAAPNAYLGRNRMGFKTYRQNGIVVEERRDAGGRYNVSSDPSVFPRGGYAPDRPGTIRDGDGHLEGPRPWVDAANKKYGKGWRISPSGVVYRANY